MNRQSPSNAALCTLRMSRFKCYLPAIDHLRYLVHSKIRSQTRTKSKGFEDVSGVVRKSQKEKKVLLELKSQQGEEDDVYIITYYEGSWVQNGETQRERWTRWDRQ